MSLIKDNLDKIRKLYVSLYSFYENNKMPIISNVKPGIHTVVMIEEYACNDDEDLKLSTHRLQLFLVKYQYLSSLQRYEDQTTFGRLKKHVPKHVIAFLTT